MTRDSIYDSHLMTEQRRGMVYERKIRSYGMGRHDARPEEEKGKSH